MTPFVTTFYSYKGGVGRTLLAANVAVLLARRGKTLLWDLDIEAPGLHRIPELTPTRQPKEGFFEWLLAWQKSGAEPEAADYIALVKAARPANVANNLFTLQAHGEKADFAGLYQDIDWNAILATDPLRGLAIFRGVLSAFGAKDFRYIVLDSRTGITDIGGLLTAVLPHLTVLVGNYGAQNTGGLQQVWRALGRASEGRIAVRNPLPPLQRLLVASPIPQHEVELGAQGRLVWKSAFGELPTQVVEVPFDSRLLLSEALLSVRSEESPLTQAYRDITADITAAEDDFLALEAAPSRHLDDTLGGELRERGTSTLKGQRFEDRIAGLLALLGYTVEREQLVGVHQVDLVVRSRVGLIDQLFLVECKDHRSEIHTQALAIFQTWIVEARHRQPTAQGMFIAQRFAPAARTYAAAQGIHVFTPAELEARLFDFSPYLRRRCAEFEGSSLFGHYVAQRIASDTPAAGDLLAHATTWAQGQGSRLWLLLGDYGTGKSSFIRQFAYKLAKAALDDRELATPMPVFIDLKDVPNAVSIDGLLLEHFRHNLSTEDFARFNPATILYLLDSGRVVLLLDSFDEMGLAQVGRSMDEQFRELAQHARAGVSARSNRILITCRTHFFRSQQQVKDVVDGPDDPLLRLDQDDTPLGKVARGLGAHIDELALFEDEQVTEFLRVHVGAQRAEEVLAFIKKTYDLPRLARRPVMLDMIMKSADRLAARHDTVTPGLLYSIYTGDWLRDRSSRQLQTTFAQRLAILETLAHALWVAPENRMHYSDLPQLLRRNERLFPGVDAARVDEELRTASFLVRDAAGYYRFAHKSFLEYFFARHLVSCWATSSDTSPVNPTGTLEYALDAPPITRECAHFMADLLVLARGSDDQTAATALIPIEPRAPLPLVAALALRSREVLAGAYRERVSENMLLLVHHMGQYSKQQGRQVGSLQTLWLGLQEAIPAGAQLAGAQLADQDLSGIALPQANLRGANLAASLLPAANLRDAVLTGATLTGALLVELNAAGADLSQVKAAGVQFIGAVLDAAKFDRADLSFTDFTGAHLFEASFRKANLWHANLHGVEAGHANFDEAVLTAVELVSANCLSASFLATQMHAARLKGCRLAGTQWAPASDAYLTAPRDPEDWIGSEVDELDPHLSSAMQRLPAQLQARLAFGHGGPVTSVAWSPDGQRLASGSWDEKTVKVWDTQSGACVLSLAGHRGAVMSVAWSADGQRLASGSGDDTVKVWDTQSGACVLSLVGHGDTVWSVAWSPDGQRLASGSWDNPVKVWDTQSGACVLSLAGDGDAVMSVAWSADGQRLASGSWDKTVKVWDAQSGACVLSLDGHDGAVRSVAWSADGQRLASGSGDNTVKVWDAQSGACVLSLDGHGDAVESVAWSADGQRLASGSVDKTVKVWDTQSGACVLSLDGHDGAVWSVAWSADSQRLASGSWDKTVKVWDTQSGACVLSLDGHDGAVRSVAWSADSQRLASGSGDNTVKVWDAQSGACVRSLDGHDGAVRSVAWNADGQRLASGSVDNTVKVWDTQSGACVRSLDGHDGAVRSVAWSADGQRLASGSVDNTVKVWDTQSGACVLSLDGHGDAVESVAWSADGQRLASASVDKTVKVWDTQSGACVLSLDGHGDAVESVAWSADSQRLASGSWDKTVKVWDTQSGACVLSLDGHGEAVTSVAWSTDGQRLASGSGDKTVMVWDTQSGKEIATLVDTPRGWLTIFADQRYRAQPGAEDYLRYVDAREAQTMATRIWHAADIAYRMQVRDDDADLASLIAPKLPAARRRKVRGRAAPAQDPS